MLRPRVPQILGVIPLLTQTEPRVCARRISGLQALPLAADSLDSIISVLSGVSTEDVGVFSATGRFTTFVAGAAVLLVVTGAFFTVFDLNTALGSSLGLPIVRIGQEAVQLQEDQEQAAEDSTYVASATVGAAGTARTSSSEGEARLTPIPTTSAPTTSTPTTMAGAGKVITQPDSSEREYVEEEVQVNNGRRPDPKTEHPGQGVGLTKNPKP